MLWTPARSRRGLFLRGAVEGRVLDPRAEAKGGKNEKRKKEIKRSTPRILGAELVRIGLCVRGQEGLPRAPAS